MNASRQDAYILKKLISKQPIAADDVVSPVMRLFINAIQPQSDIGYKRLHEALGADYNILQDVMKVDPDVPPILEEKIINANHLKNLVRPEYALTDYPFYRFGLNALVGASGTGKSFVALDFAALLASALSSGSVLYIAAEGLHGYASRWEAWKQHNRADTQNLEFYSTPVNFMVPSEVDLFVADVQSYKPAMIVIDTVARCMAGGDENSTKDMTQFVDQVERARRMMSAGVLLVHHTGKDGKMRGNSALYAACDSVVFLNKSESRIGLHNKHDSGGKNKYSKEAPSRFVELRPLTVTVKGEDVESAALVEAASVFQADDDELTSNQQILLDTLQEESGLTAKMLIEITDLPPATVYRNLGKLRKMDYVHQTGDYYYLKKRTGDDDDGSDIPF